MKSEEFIDLVKKQLQINSAFPYKDAYTRFYYQATVESRGLDKI